MILQSIAGWLARSREARKHGDSALPRHVSEKLGRFSPENARGLDGQHRLTHVALERIDAVAEHVGDRLDARLRQPLRGVAPGQTMVLYRPDARGDEVIGSATII